jgi:predicted nucleic acid-binding protein
MARYFLDSSALVKRCHSESGTADMDAFFNAPGNRFFISRLALVEVQSSLARLVREQALTEKVFRELTARLEDDVAAGILNVLAVGSRRLEGAAALTGSHGLRHNVRTLDAIHLATAQALHGRSRLAGFVAADKKLLALAANACGLIVISVG